MFGSRELGHYPVGSELSSLLSGGGIESVWARQTYPEMNDFAMVRWTQRQLRRYLQKAWLRYGFIFYRKKSYNFNRIW